MVNKQRSPRRIYQNPVMNEPTWFCVRCQKTFATNYSLRRHMGLIHRAPRTVVEAGDDGVMYGNPHYDNDSP